MATDLSTIIKLEVPIIVQVGARRVALEEILSLGPGVILDLGKSAEDELTLLVNNKSIGRGEAVKIGENFGIRVTALDSPAARVRALGIDAG